MATRHEDAVSASRGDGAAIAGRMSAPSGLSHSLAVPPFAPCHFPIEKSNTRDAIAPPDVMPTPLPADTE